uniref:Activin_recp domain-containing protein n=1 Tax=Globodera pallida TaxID=36090 RepID=A0A183BKU9_GLOPA
MCVLLLLLGVLLRATNEKSTAEVSSTTEVPTAAMSTTEMVTSKYCKVTCCDGNACNGTLGLRSVGTVAAMMAFFAVLFVHWH